MPPRPLWPEAEKVALRTAVAKHDAKVGNAKWEAVAREDGISHSADQCRRMNDILSREDTKAAMVLQVEVGDQITVWEAGKGVAPPHSQIQAPQHGRVMTPKLKYDWPRPYPQKGTDPVDAMMVQLNSVTPPRTVLVPIDKAAAGWRKGLPGWWEFGRETGPPPLGATEQKARGSRVASTASWKQANRANHQERSAQLTQERRRLAQDVPPYSPLADDPTKSYVEQMRSLRASIGERFARQERVAALTGEAQRMVTAQAAEARASEQSFVTHEQAGTSVGAVGGNQWVVDHLVEYDGRKYPAPRSAGFRVRWQGYAAKHDTWEPASELSDDLKLEFWRDLQQRDQKGTREMNDAERKACARFMKRVAQ